MTIGTVRVAARAAWLAGVAEVGDQRRQRLVTLVRPARLEADRPLLHVSQLAQAVPARFPVMPPAGRREGEEISDPRDLRRGLGRRRPRPCGGRDQSRQERTTSHAQRP
jgi:hypothetical protein